MSTPPITAFERMSQEMAALPLWVKHVIFVQLKSDLERSLTQNTLEALGNQEPLQLLVPQLSHTGRKELEQPSGMYPAQLLKLMHCAAQRKDVVNICITNNWTLEQCCTYLLEGIEKELMAPPTTTVTQATLLYLGNKIRIGDYLVKIGKLSIEQLDQALRTQRYIEESLGEKTGIANVLINLGYIQKQDSEGILFLKEESKKTFPPMVMGMASDGQGPDPASYAKLQQDFKAAIDHIRKLEARQQQAP